MSRHRNMRHMIADNDYYYDDDDYYYYDDNYDDYDDYGATPQQQAPKAKKQAAKKQQQQTKKTTPQKQQQQQQQAKSNKTTDTPVAKAAKQQQQTSSDAALPSSVGSKVKIIAGGTTISRTTTPRTEGGISVLAPPTSPPPGFSSSTSLPPPISSVKPPQQRPQQTATPPPPQSTTTGPATQQRAEVPKILLESTKRGKPSLTLVILGHVDAGKSTITGQLLFHAENNYNGNTNNTNDNGNGSNNDGTNSTTTPARRRLRPPTNFAWLLDEDEQERARGITMDIGTKTMETRKFNLVLQDAPGHADYVPAMITGTATADAALVVVDVTDLDTALGGGGQLQEHLTLARGLGVNQILLGLNKMDLVRWEESTYREISSKLIHFLTKSLGYPPGKIRVVPVSGLTGINVIHRDDAPPSFTSWYNNDDNSSNKGKKDNSKCPTLYEALDGFEAPARGQAQSRQKVLEKPVRIILADVLQEQGKGRVAVRGKVVQGWMQQGETMTVLPVGDTAVVHKLTKLQQENDAASNNNNGTTTGNTNTNNNYAAAGEMVRAVLSGVDAMRLSAGNVLARPDARTQPKLARKCRARVWILSTVAVPVIRGAQAIFHMHHIDVPCHFSQLLHTLKNTTTTTTQQDAGTAAGGTTKNGDNIAKLRPRALSANTQAAVELTLAVPIAMEAFKDCRALARFVLRRSGESIAVGRIEQVIL